MTNYKITKSTDRKVTKSNHLVQCKSTFSALEHRINIKDVRKAVDDLHQSVKKWRSYSFIIKAQGGIWKKLYRNPIS